MNGAYERYEIAWIPTPGSPLARFGAAWTGWCPDAAERRQRVFASRLPVAPQDVTGALSRQGMRATICGPFTLKPGKSRWLLERELSLVTDALSVFRLPRLGVAVIDGRVCLAPVAGDGVLDMYVDSIWKTLERFVAPRPPSEIRVGSGKIQFVESQGAGGGGTPEHAQDWFHLPLTERLKTEQATALAQALSRTIEPILAEAPVVRDFALIGDPGHGRALRVEERFQLPDLVVQSSSQLPCYGPRVITALGEKLRGPGVLDAR